MRISATRRTCTGLATILAACCLTAAAGAQELRVAAASDLQSVLPDVVQRFERETGRHVGLTFGSSGNFFTQIQNGAPFDVFLSADVEYPRQLEAAGLAAPGSVTEYAIGKIVLWARTSAPIDVSQGLAGLTNPAVRRIAIANPEHAPYGRAAIAALQRQGLYEQVRGKLVFGENISQAAQFVQSGNADAGILALSLALSPAMSGSGRYAEIPQAIYPALRQGAAVVNASPSKDLASRFVAFLKRPDVSQLLAAAGFAPPPPATR